MINLYDTQTLAVTGYRYNPATDCLTDSLKILGIKVRDGEIKVSMKLSGGTLTIDTHPIGLDLKDTRTKPEPISVSPKNTPNITMCLYLLYYALIRILVNFMHRLSTAILQTKHRTDPSSSY